MGRWLGFDEISSGHRIYWPNQRKVSVERSVQFEDVLEGELDSESVKHAPAAPAANGDVMDFRELDVVDVEKEDEPQVEVPPATVDEPELEEDVHVPEPPAPAPPAEEATIRRSSRVRTDARIVRDIKSGLGSATGHTRDIVEERGVAEDEDDSDWEEVYAFVVETGAAEGIEPQSLAEAKQLPDWPEWDRAMKEEIATLERTGTYIEVEAPQGVNIVGCKWGFFGSNATLLGT